jgi:hypothetical protein
LELPDQQRLECISLILCRDIYRDEETKNLILVGTFNNINTSAIPFSYPSLSVLVTLTNGLGQYDLQISIEHEETGTEVMRAGGPLVIAHPESINDLNVKLQGVPFQHAGRHWIVMRSNGEVIQRRPFTIAHTPVEIEDQREEVAHARQA